MDYMQDGLPAESAALLHQAVVGLDPNSDRPNEILLESEIGVLLTTLNLSVFRPWCIPRRNRTH